ncbi:hypothetical protein ACWEOH_14690 [Agromyces sp. NPDC004153]
MSSPVDIAPERDDEAATRPARRRARLVWLAIVGIIAFVAAWWGSQALLGLLSPGAGGSGQAGGVRHTSEAGYEVVFPGEPEESRSTKSYPGFESQVTVATWSDDSATYTVRTREFPAELVEGAGDRILEDLVYELRESTPGEHLREKHETSLDGEPALSGTISSGDRDIHFTVAMHGTADVLLTQSVPAGDPASPFAETLRFVD